MASYYVCIMTNNAGTLYTGVTNDLERRVLEPKAGSRGSFAQRYRINRLLYFEETDDVTAAIEREKQIKGWLRRRKRELVRSVNPGWRDLSEDWYASSDEGLPSAEDQILRSAQNDGCEESQLPAGRGSVEGQILRSAQNDGFEERRLPAGQLPDGRWPGGGQTLRSAQSPNLGARPRAKRPLDKFQDDNRAPGRHSATGSPLPEGVTHA